MIHAAKYVARKLERDDLTDSHSTHKLSQFANNVINDNLKDMKLSFKYKIFWNQNGPRGKGRLPQEGRLYSG